MPARDTTPLGGPCWVDLTTTDTDRARHFYSRLFGWTAEEPDEKHGGYFNWRRDGVRIAGCVPAQPAAPARNAWSVYLATGDARRTVDDAAGAGARVIVPAMDVADLGTMAVLTDPDGGAIGVWQPARHRGFGIVGETGAPSWFELHTREYQAELDFYRRVFGWRTDPLSDSPEFRYSLLKSGEEMLAGIMDASRMLPEGTPARWSVYFGVDDADAALATIVDLGGAIAQPAEDTPYGRLAAATDATGAAFKLVAPNAAMPARG